MLVVVLTGVLALENPAKLERTVFSLSDVGKQKKMWFKLFKPCKTLPNG
jgi:hypothetical protein